MSASPKLPLPSGIPATDTETERQILRKLEAITGGDERVETLWRLMFFYQEQAKRSDLAIALLELIIQESNDTEDTAVAYFALGQIAQANDKWAEALIHYGNGLSISPKQRTTAYFLGNNAGYCLNALRLYKAGERHCRQAIEIDSERVNAFRNLGISLYGQGDLKGAAWCWVEAIARNPLESNARELLNQLLTKHPALKSECRWIQQELKQRGKKHSG